MHLQPWAKVLAEAAESCVKLPFEIIRGLLGLQIESAAKPLLLFKHHTLDHF